MRIPFSEGFSTLRVSTLRAARSTSEVKNISCKESFALLFAVLTGEAFRDEFRRIGKSEQEIFENVDKVRLGFPQFQKTLDSSSRAPRLGAALRKIGAPATINAGM